MLGNDNFIGGDRENLNKEVKFFQITVVIWIKCMKLLMVVIMFIIKATAHEGLSVFFLILLLNIFQSSVSVFTASIKANVKKIIYCSSMARYGSIEPP